MGEALCACSGQAGEDCRRGDDGDYSDDGDEGGGEHQAERKRRLGALGVVVAGVPWVHRAGADRIGGFLCAVVGRSEDSPTTRLGLGPDILNLIGSGPMAK
jgi:hypothetical protein